MKNAQIDTWATGAALFAHMTHDLRPLDATGHPPKVTPPEEWRSVVPSGGAASTKPILSDGGFLPVIPGIAPLL
jgi:hypothetical protein